MTLCNSPIWHSRMQISIASQSVQTKANIVLTGHIVCRLIVTLLTHAYWARTPAPLWYWFGKLSTVVTEALSTCSTMVLLFLIAEFSMAAITVLKNKNTNWSGTVSLHGIHFTAYNNWSHSSYREIDCCSRLCTLTHVPKTYLPIWHVTCDTMSTLCSDIITPYDKNNSWKKIIHRLIW